MSPPDTAVATVEPTALASVRKPPAEAIRQLERVVLEGNLAGLTEGERVAYYARVCESLGLNPLTRPFEYMSLQGKLTLYARKDATDQLRGLHAVTIDRIERERDAEMGLSIVTAYARDRYGRTDTSIGVMSIKGLSGEALANALMKAETKAKRRVTLSICGLGWMDEVEAQDARAIEVAPRQQLSSAIRSRTAALTGGTNEPGESEASGHAGGATAEGASTPPSAGSPGCAHDPKSQVADERGVTCSDCGTLLAEREPDATKPRARTASRKPKAEKKALQPGDDGYGTARAHAVAAERGLDHAAVHRIAADVLSIATDDLEAFSVKDLVEADWGQVIGAISEAPAVVEDDESTTKAAEEFAGQAALQAGLGSGDDPWPEAEPAAVDMFATDLNKLTAAHWTEFGIRIAARNPLP